MDIRKDNNEKIKRILDSLKQIMHILAIDNSRINNKNEP